MKPNICTHFLKGHCKFKNFCRKSHDILTCKFGRSCNFPSCPFRHPPDCKNFLLNQCGFQSKDNIFVPYSFCNHYHPPPFPYSNLPTTHPLVFHTAPVIDLLKKQQPVSLLCNLTPLLLLITILPYSLPDLPLHLPYSNPPQTLGGLSLAALRTINRRSASQTSSLSCLALRQS